MNTPDLLHIAGVPVPLHTAALESMAEAEHRASGLLWHKLKVRYIHAEKIAQLIPWEAERLIDVRPDLASWDIEPIQHIRSYGDSAPHWHMTPDGGRPVPGAWLDTDPASAEYQEAVASCYWCPGHHPRSRGAVKAWYRRNGGAYEAYQRGLTVNPADGFKQWAGDHDGTSARVSRIGDAWIVAAEKRYGPLTLRIRKGFEVDNVFGQRRGEMQFVQMWFPIAGHDLRAPATWSMRPKFGAAK